MVKEENFPNAFKEVYVILQQMDKEHVKKIPEDFMKIIEKNKNDDYEYTYNESVSFDNQILMRETEAILGHIFLNYWADENQKSTIINNLKMKDAQEEQAKLKQYSIEDMFKSKNDKDKDMELDSTSKESKIKENQISVYETESIFTKIMKRIKSFFG
ncbi:MAG: hypothetical protein J6J36_05640 [Clostridia bacterium]|nr:hypothetical protein [Clostridia bacterium]